MELLPGVLRTSLKIRALVCGSAQHSFSHQRNAYERKKILVLYIKKEPKIIFKMYFFRPGECKDEDETTKNKTRGDGRCLLQHLEIV